jgi:hypothetical protein
VEVYHTWWRIDWPFVQHSTFDHRCLQKTHLETERKPFDRFHPGAGCCSCRCCAERLQDSLGKHRYCCCQCGQCCFVGSPCGRVGQLNRQE